MSAKLNDVPDAWDDDWETQIDESTTPAESEPAKKVSSRAIKAQRRAQHAEFNRQLWAEAESPQAFHFLESRPSPPLSSDYKPAVKVLTRKPQTTGNSSPSYTLDSAAVGVKRLTIASPRTASTTTAVDSGTGEGADDDDDLSDDERIKRRQQLTHEERLAKTQREREEKQRKYEEVRERLFGTPTPGSGASSPGNTTPPGQQQQQGGENRWKGRNKSSGGSKNSRERREAPSTSTKSRQLFDPTYSAKPNLNYAQRKERGQKVPGETDEDPQRPQLQLSHPPPQAPIRSPRGPDGSGRGGFGFSQRGARNV